MRAIILAAGIGSRLGKLTAGNPKSMLKIGNKSLIHHQIDACKEAGISHFVFVLGYKREILENHIKEILSTDEFSIVYNPIYDKTNTLYSLWLASQDYFDESFIYFNADVLFLKDLLKKINEENGKTELLLDTRRCAEEEVKIIHKEKNVIAQIGKKLDPKICAGEFIGVGKFDKNDLPLFKEKLQFGVDNNQSNNYFEFAVDLLAKEKNLYSVSTDGLPCIEIDFPEDLERAKNIVFPQMREYS